MITKMDFRQPYSLVFAYYKYISVMVLLLCPASCCIPDEAETLLQFKENVYQMTNKVDGGKASDMSPLASWLEGINCCNWSGVTCDPVSGRVQELNLFQLDINSTGNEYIKPLSSLKNLSHLEIDTVVNERSDDVVFANISAILSALADFPSLEYISISFSYYHPMKLDLSPWKLASLQRLKHLSLRQCQLYGRLPPQLSNMSSLTYLDLGSNYFTSNLEALGGLSSLRYLDLWSSNFSSNFEVLGGLSSLRHLDLQENNLNETSTLSFITSLQSLQYLDISSCRYHGIIPHSISNLINLHYLDMSYNNINGEIPYRIRNLSGLRYLWLGYNNLSGSIPETIGDLPRLLTLSLSTNRLSGSMPSSVSKMLNLTSLDLSFNLLSGDIPSSLTLPPLLKTFFISYNNMTGNVSQNLFGNNTSLIQMDFTNSGVRVDINPSWIPQFSAYLIGLSSCKIGGTFPSWISTQYNIEYLDLSNNSFYGDVPTWLWDLPSYSAVLNLSFNSFQGSLDYFGNFYMVDLSSNRFTRFSKNYTGFNRIREGKYIKQAEEIRAYLYVNDNRMNGELPPSIGRMSWLVHLDASNNNISGPLPHFTNPSALELLNLENNRFRGNLPAGFGTGFASLKSLSLQNNELEGQLPRSLKNCSQLKVLSIGNNSFEGQIPKWITLLKLLQILDMKGNNFSGSIPSEMGNMTNLHFLDLSFNQISGYVPPTISHMVALTEGSYDTSSHNLIASYCKLLYSVGRIFFPLGKRNNFNELTVHSKGIKLLYPRILYSMTFIDISGNNLIGEIPEKLGGLKGLRFLNLSRNHLIGSIPDSMGSMLQLESLDLSFNNLTGRIPQEFVHLDMIGYLNVSYNNLIGRVPREGHMSSIPESAFIGNHVFDPNIPKSPLIADSQEEDESKINDYFWWKVSVGISFGAGYAGFIIVVIYVMPLRYRIFKIMDTVILRIPIP